MASTTVSGEPDPESEEAQRDSPEQLLLLANLKLVLARLPEDEQRLIGSMIPKKGDQFSRTPPEGRRRFSLSPEEDQRFKRAWEPFLRTYQKRVERLARKVSPNDWEDLYAVGALALLHAAWKYEDTGKSFWSYAHVIVSRAMFFEAGAQHEYDSTTTRAYSQVRKARGRLIERRQQDDLASVEKSPTAAEIAAHIEVSTGNKIAIKRIEQILSTNSSLDAMQKAIETGERVSEERHFAAHGDWQDPERALDRPQIRQDRELQRLRALAFAVGPHRDEARRQESARRGCRHLLIEALKWYSNDLHGVSWGGTEIAARLNDKNDRELVREWPGIVADYGLPVLLPATWDAACRRFYEDPPPDIARFARALEQLKQAELPGDPVQTGIIAALERYNQTQRAAPSGGGTPASLRGMADLASRLANPTDPGMARTWATILAAEYLDQAACAVVMPLTWAAMCDLFLGKRDPHDIVTPGLVRQAWKRGKDTDPLYTGIWLDGIVRPVRLRDDREISPRG